VCHLDELCIGTFRTLDGMLSALGDSLERRLDEDAQQIAPDEIHVEKRSGKLLDGSNIE
jgi:hypothetical protein